MEKRYTTIEVAEALGISVAQVRVVARKLNLGERFGRAWVFTGADIEAMRGRDTKTGPKPKTEKRPQSED